MTGGIHPCQVAPGCPGLAVFGFSVPAHVAHVPGTLWACRDHRSEAEARWRAKVAELTGGRREPRLCGEPMGQGVLL